jgi:SAM-dependent methyltransferase
MKTRDETLKDYYTEIKLDPSYFDLYIVRKNILNSIMESLHTFNGDILDVGCGIMPYKEIILKNNKNITSYKGLDFESPVNNQYSLVKPDIFWDGEIIPLENNSINTIIATEVFEHCPEPEKVMKEMFRVLKKGGLIFFTVPFFWYLHLVPFDEYRYTPFSLKRHLANAGFINIELNELGGWDASLAQMITMWYSRRPLSSNKKRILYKLLKPVVKMLIKKDKLLPGKNQFKEGDMITGISGFAHK